MTSALPASVTILDLPAVTTLVGTESLEAVQGNTSVRITVNQLSSSILSGVIDPSHGGTGTSTIFPTGAVIFANGAGVYAGTTTFNWNNQSGFLGINTQSAAANLTVNNNPGTLPIPQTGTQLHLISGNASACTVQMDAFGNVSRFFCRRANGTSGSLTALTTNDAIMQFTGRGYDGTAYSANQAALVFFAGEPWNSTSHGTYFQLQVTANGTTSPASPIRVNATTMGIGTQSPQAALHVTANSTVTSPGLNGIYFSAADATSGSFIADSYAAPSQLVLRRAEGTAGGLAPPSSGFTVFRIHGAGYDGATYTSGLELRGVTAETWNATSHGMDLTFLLAAAGTTTLSEKMRLTGTGSLGVGTPTPQALLHVNANSTVIAPSAQGIYLSGADGATPTMSVDAFGAAPLLTMRRAAGTAGGLAALASGVGFFTFFGGGYDGTTYANSVTRFRGVTSETWNATSHGAALDFAVTPTGSTTLVVGMTINPSGGVSVGTAVDPGAGGIIANSYLNSIGGFTRVATQFNATTTTTLANITNLSSSLSSAANYAFNATLFVNADVTGGQKYAMGGTVTASSIIYEVLTTNNASSTIAISGRGTALGAAFGQAGSTANFTIIEGLITTNASGTLAVQFAQNAASGTSNVLVGSHLKVWQFS